MFAQQIAQCQLDQNTTTPFVFLKLDEVEDDIKALDQVIGPKFANLFQTTKLTLMGFCSAYNGIKMSDPGQSIVDAVGSNDFGLINQLNNTSSYANRQLATMLIKYYYRIGLVFSFYFVDIMALKTANDCGVKGQASGDAFLKLFINSLDQILRDMGFDGIIFHFGGDEILIISPSGMTLDMKEVQARMSQIDTSEIVDPSSVLLIDKFLQAKNLFDSRALEELDSFVKLELHFKEFLPFVWDCINLPPSKLVNINMLISLLECALIMYDQIIENSFQFRRASDIEQILSSPEVKQKALQVLPKFELRFCYVKGVINPKFFQDHLEIIDYITNCPELKDFNAKTKKQLWKDKSLLALYMDLRGDYRAMRSTDS